jgi:hypothetical protein
MSTIAVRAEAPTPVELVRSTAPRVACSIFACPGCNWPLIGAKFTSCTADDIHEAVFELLCNKCNWRGAMLGRDAVQLTITDWSKRISRHAIQGV